MANKYTTAAAASFCTENGRRVSNRTFEGYRKKAPADPGEHGPRFFRDPLTQTTYYLELDLLAWISELDARLIERGRSQQPKELAA